MDFNDKGQVINGSGTYAAIASGIAGGKSVLVAWTDVGGKEYDLIFTQGPAQSGTPKNGWRSDDIFLGVDDIGVAAFIRSNQDIDINYVKDSYNGLLSDPTLTNITILLNEVRKLM